MNNAIEFVRDIRHCAEPWTWNLLQEDGEITYSPDRDARTGWIRYKCKTAKAFTEVLKTLEYCRGCFCRDNGYTRRFGLRGVHQHQRGLRSPDCHRLLRIHQALNSIRPGAPGLFKEDTMKVLQFIAAAVLAASIGALTGYIFADMPQVYQSNSTGEVKGWEDSTGYHACHAGTDCRIPAEYDLIWVE